MEHLASSKMAVKRKQEYSDSLGVHTKADKRSRSSNGIFDAKKPSEVSPDRPIKLTNKAVYYQSQNIISKKNNVQDMIKIIDLTPSSDDETEEKVNTRYEVESLVSCELHDHKKDRIHDSFKSRRRGGASEHALSTDELNSNRLSKGGKSYKHLAESSDKYKRSFPPNRPAKGDSIIHIDSSKQSLNKRAGLHGNIVHRIPRKPLASKTRKECLQNCRSSSLPVSTNAKPSVNDILMCTNSVKEIERKIWKFKKFSDISIEAAARKMLKTKYLSVVSILKAYQEEEKGNIASQTKEKNVYYRKATKALYDLCKKLPGNRVGSIPGIESGDIFHNREMLRIFGLHKPSQAGIDFIVNEDGTALATSIILSGRYEDNIDNGNIVIYSGHGGNDYDGSHKQIEDQTITRANKALMNSSKLEQPVRLFRFCGHGVENVPSGSYRYDGLYDVEVWNKGTGISGFRVFKYKLVRRDGQPPLSFYAVSFVRNCYISRNRRYVVKEDISEGEESFHISVVNSVDSSEFPADFEYSKTIIYPEWLKFVSHDKCCNCADNFCNTESCPCAGRNGRQFTYSEKGIIVQEKPIVYECGPWCSSCRNKVSQNGMKHKVQVFRTPNREWGLRCLDFIQAGEFIAEFVGDIVVMNSSHRKEGKRYVFPIPMQRKGRENLDDDVSAPPLQHKLRFALDASKRGNASRFIRRHSRPNVFAQYVVYDDKHDPGVPHVMLFASENIPPGMELFLPKN